MSMTYDFLLKTNALHHWLFIFYGENLKNLSINIYEFIRQSSLFSKISFYQRIFKHFNSIKNYIAKNYHNINFIHKKIPETSF